MLDPTLLAHLEPNQFYHQWMQTYFPKRPDNREMHQYRQMSIQPGSIGTADGSSLVRVGETTVIAGVKAEVSEVPLGSTSMTPAGYIIPNVHFASGANPKTRPGPPSEDVQELSAKISECLDKINFVDLEKLSPLDGLVWNLYVDVAVLNDDGNIWDAIWLALVAALRDTLLPTLAFDEATGVVSIVEESTTPLIFKIIPAPMSLVEFKDEFMLDPNHKETDIFRTHLNVLFDLNNPSKILYVSADSKKKALDASKFSAIINAHCNLIRQHLMQ